MTDEELLVMYNKYKRKRKLILLFVITTISLVLIFFFFNSSKEKEPLKETDTEPPKIVLSEDYIEVEEGKEIDYDAYKEMINNKESFILFIGSDECSHCADYEITLNRVIKKYNVEVNYLNLLDMSDEQLNEFKSQISFTGTPTTIFIKNGEEDSHYNRIVGAVDYDEVVKKFEDNGYIEVE